MYGRECGIEDSTMCSDFGHICDLLFFIKNSAMADATKAFRL